MRIEINAGGLGSALSVVEYQVGINAVALDDLESLGIKIK